MRKSFNLQSGFALLYALLVTSITLSASLIVTNIITRQLITASTATRGFVAYAAANDGFSCAYFLDRWFKGVADDGILDPTFPSGQRCSGQNIVLNTPPGSSVFEDCQTKSIVREFTLNLHPSDRSMLGGSNDPFVRVQICSNGYANGDGRLFVAEGFNVGDPNNPRRVKKIFKQFST